MGDSCHSIQIMPSTTQEQAFGLADFRNEFNNLNPTLCGDARNVTVGPVRCDSLASRRSGQSHRWEQGISPMLDYCIVPRNKAACSSLARQPIDRSRIPLNSLHAV